MMLCRFASCASAAAVSGRTMPPVGFDGVTRRSALERGVMRFSTSSGRMSNPSSAKVGTLHRDSPRMGDRLIVGGIAWIRHQHFVARIEQRAHDQEQALPGRRS